MPDQFIDQSTGGLSAYLLVVHAHELMLLLLSCVGLEKFWGTLIVVCKDGLGSEMHCHPRACYFHAG